MFWMKLMAAFTAVALGSAVATLPAPPATAAPETAVTAQAPRPTGATLPVTGTLADGTAFTGALGSLTTDVVGGVLQLSGTVTGTGIPEGGAPFTAPVQELTTSGADGPGSRAGCSILNLDLGPLHLDLLGLVIDLSPISLDITAVPGAGNLLGNLLCAIAGLLDNPGGGPLAGIVNLLNRLLAGLGLAA